MQVILLLVTRLDATAHTLKTYRVPGVKESTVVVFVDVVWFTSLPNNLYDISDITDAHPNSSDVLDDDSD